MPTILPAMRRALASIVATSGLLAAAAAVAQLDDDPRSARPAPPTTVAEAAARFLTRYVPFGTSGSVELAQGETRTFSQGVEAGVCYAVVAVADDDVDIDARVRRDGLVVAQDVSLDSYPIVEWCPSTAGTETVTIRAFGGAARVEYAMYVDPDTRAAATGELDELSNRLAAHVAGSAPRWTPSGGQWRSTFAAPGERTMTVDVPERRCVAVAAVGQTTVTDIDLLMESSEGVELSRDFALDATPLVAYCADAAGTVTVRVGVRTGTGVVAAQVLETPFERRQ